MSAARQDQLGSNAGPAVCVTDAFRGAQSAPSFTPSLSSSASQASPAPSPSKSA
jgi:hypothetical protein